MATPVGGTEGVWVRPLMAKPPFLPKAERPEPGAARRLGGASALWDSRPKALLPTNRSRAVVRGTTPREYPFGCSTASQSAEPFPPPRNTYAALRNSQLAAASQVGADGFVGWACRDGAQDFLAGRVIWPSGSAGDLCGRTPERLLGAPLPVWPGHLLVDADGGDVGSVVDVFEVDEPGGVAGGLDGEVGEVPEFDGDEC